MPSCCGRLIEKSSPSTLLTFDRYRLWHPSSGLPCRRCRARNRRNLSTDPQIRFEQFATSSRPEIRSMRIEDATFSEDILKLWFQLNLKKKSFDVPEEKFQKQFLKPRFLSPFTTRVRGIRLTPDTKGWSSSLKKFKTLF